MVEQKPRELEVGAQADQNTDFSKYIKEVISKVKIVNFISAYVWIDSNVVLNLLSSTLTERQSRTEHRLEKIPVQTFSAIPFPRSL